MPNTTKAEYLLDFNYKDMAYYSAVKKDIKVMIEEKPWTAL
jgi:hypothetical protein